MVRRLRRNSLCHTTDSYNCPFRILLAIIGSPARLFDQAALIVRAGLGRQRITAGLFPAHRDGICLKSRW